MNAYLQKVNGSSIPVALGQAIAGFRRRECGDAPTWAAAGIDVRLEVRDVRSYGLRLKDVDCRPGCVVVGID